MNRVPWAPENYTARLNQIHEWAEGLGVEPDALELAIVQKMAELKGDEWAKPRR